MCVEEEDSETVAHPKLCVCPYVWIRGRQLEELEKYTFHLLQTRQMREAG